MFPNIEFSQLRLMDALDMAILVEIEAFERYTLFSNQLGHRYPADAADVFRKMAESEKKHVQELSEKRNILFADTPVEVSKDSLFDVEAPEIASLRWNMSPFKAFQIVLSSEHKAFAFYDEALSYVTDDEVRELFTELRDEEAEHVNMIEQFISQLPEQAYRDLEDED